MIKTLIVVSVVASVLGQEYDFTNNLVDFDETPYQVLPYPGLDREKRIMNLRKKPIKNPIVMDNRYEGIRGPAYLIDSREVITSLANVQSSLTATLSAFSARFLGGLNSALKLLAVNIPALIFGAVVTIGFCKITSLCSKIMSIESLKETVKEFSSFVTAEKLDMASQFMQEALRRYGSLQADLLNI